MESDKLIDAAYNSIYVSFLRDGKLRDEDITVAFKQIIRRGVADYLRKNPEESVVAVSDLDIPRPTTTSDITPLLYAVVEEDGIRLASEDLDVDVMIPDVDIRVGDIPDADIDLEGEFPILPNAVLSDDLLDQTTESINRAFGADRTKGFKKGMVIPEKVRQDPFGADFTGQMGIIPNE